MSKKKIIKDKFRTREANKYANPIVSREYILEHLAQRGMPMFYPELAGELGLTNKDNQIALKRRLKAMVRDGQLVRTRKGSYGIVSKMDLIRGRVQGHRDGFGFVVPEEGGDDLYLSPREMRKVFDSDLVLVSLVDIDYRGRKEATIVEVLERRVSQIVGRFWTEEGISYLVPDNKRINQDVLIPQGQEGTATPGQYVVAQITVQPSQEHKPQGRVIEILGDALAPGMEIDVAIRSHDLPHVWPTPVLDEIKTLKPEVLEKDKACRVDLRDLAFVTIDGEDAKDFDDAVFCEPQGKAWRLVVAIADVSHYVVVGSALDEEAIRRGNSVYFPGKVLPMLPEILSNGLCSLNPKVDRLCIACDMQINSKGVVTHYQFYEAVFCSKARLTYTEVAHFLEKPKEAKNFTKTHAAVVTPLQNLYALYKVLRKARVKRGALDIDTVETKILFNSQRKIEAIVPVVRNEAHQLIEEAMLCANVAAAQFLQHHGLTGLYRVHDAPPPDKVAQFKQFLGGLGLGLSKTNQPSVEDYQRLLQEISQRADKQVINSILLRSLSQAVYSPDNKGHFGLAYEAYTHFTSPIRRYPDLLVHRALRAVIRSRIKTDKVQRVKAVKIIPRETIYPYSPQQMAALGEQTSMTERRADEATRDVVDRLKCEYMLDHLGEELMGTVNGVTSFGLFVLLDNIFIEGLVHVTALRNDYYHFDPIKHCLRGERTGSAYQLGDKVPVRVVRVSTDDRKIDLEVLNANSSEDRPARAKKKKRRR